MIQDDSVFNTNQAMRQIQRAQLTLSKVEGKFRGLHKDKVQLHKRQIKAPLPDLSKYISLLGQEEEMPIKTPIFQKRRKQTLFVPNIPYLQSSNKKYSDKKIIKKYKDNQYLYSNFNSKDLLNRDLNFQLLEKKNKDLAKLQQFYLSENQKLDQKIMKLKKKIQKVKKDKILLNRDNQEIQTTLLLHREVESQKRQQTNQRNQIQSLKKAIQSIEAENIRIMERKNDLQNNLEQMIASQKHQMYKQLKIKSKKNNSHQHTDRPTKFHRINNRCPYHR